MKVYKYPLEITDEQRVEMPRGAGILSAMVQGGTLCLWALVDQNAPMEGRNFRIYGTGNDAEGAEDLIFVGSVMTNGGALVWHIFEVEG